MVCGAYEVSPGGQNSVALKAQNGREQVPAVSVWLDQRAARIDFSIWSVGLLISVLGNSSMILSVTLT
jgi:hypothetical protein